MSTTQQTRARPNVQARNSITETETRFPPAFPSGAARASETGERERRLQTASGTRESISAGALELTSDAEAFGRLERLAEVYLLGGLGARDAWAAAIADYVCA